MSAYAGGWLAEQHAADHRRFLNVLAASFVVHALSLVVLAVSPSSDAPLLPEVLMVDLVSLPAPGASASRPPPPAPVPATPIPSKPIPSTPVPSTPIPSKPMPKEVVLPKQAPRAVPKKRVVKAPARPEPIEYDDALSQLRNELGESTPSPVPAPRPTEEVSDEALQATTAAATSPAGKVDPEVAAWMVAIKRHVRRGYVTLPEFMNRQLATGIEVSLSASGELVGPLRVVWSSGDPFFDDNAIRTVRVSAPLPAPPRSGAYTFMFTSEER